MEQKDEIGLCDCCLAKFNEWLSQQPVVYTEKAEPNQHQNQWFESEFPSGVDTHRARLVDIQEIGEGK